MTLTDRSLESWGERLTRVSAAVSHAQPGERPERQPVHTVYGGAQLFTADTAKKLGQMALAALDRWLPDPPTMSAVLGTDPELARHVHLLVREKLEREPVEDYRIDFEDGYGHRPDEEEDHHARAAAREMAEAARRGVLPPYLGIRIKSLSGELHRRSLRTLDLFVTSAVEAGGEMPPGFCVTLPKIQDREQVRVLTEALAELEQSHGLAPIPIELMVETPQTVIDGDGAAGLRKFVEAGGGRVRGAHFGTYDYTASLNITAAYQSMTHPACDFARHMLQVSLAGTGVWLSDGATNAMPVPIHRGGDLTPSQEEENRRVVHDVMRLHHDHVRQSLGHAYYQGWDLHPAQLPTRFAAVFSFFLEGLDDAGARLSNFIESAAQATLVGEVFDDAATGQGLLNYFLRAINCGAIEENEALERTGLTVEEIRSRSFLAILDGRTAS